MVVETDAGRPSRDRPAVIPTDTRPTILDLFCGAGGAAMGYYRAGFDVVGVDIVPQPRYPFAFIQADALAYLDSLTFLELMQFAMVHASPPCQRYSRATPEVNKAGHPDLLAPTREALIASGLPYIIENVEGARQHMIDPVMLCGSSFDLHVRRHRLFESSMQFLVPKCAHGLEETREARYITTTRPRSGRRTHTTFVNAHATGARYNTDDLRDAMEVRWMTHTKEIREAIPPAYTQLLGSQTFSLIPSPSTSTPARAPEGSPLTG